MFVGCDSNEDGDDGVLGRWQSTDEDEFLNISEDEIVVHVEDEDDNGDGCVSRQEYEVVDIDGDEWTFEDAFGESSTIILRRDGDDLVITFVEEGDDDTTRYERSTRTDFSPLCG